jgi:DNA repair exonuclease SbcCD ATPase subunit
MKIVRLTSENVKKLTAVEITPEGNLVAISGKNGAGKTSILDSIFWALAGTKGIQSAPIRKGATEARIKLDLGEIIVTRTFSEGDAGYTTKMKVERADGYRAAKPQELLNDMLSSLCFDPLAFCRMKPRDQFDQLAQFVPGVDFDKIEADNKRDFDRRTDINRQAKQARAAADIIQVPLNLPAEPIDEAALVAELEQAGKHNATLETRAERRAHATERLNAIREAEAALPAETESKKGFIRSASAKLVREIDGQISALQRKIMGLREAETRELNAANDAERETFQRLRAEAADIEAKLAAAGDLPEAVDTAEIRQRIDAARAANAAIRQRDQRQRQLETAASLEAQAKALTEGVAARTEAKEAAIAAAALPVPGVAFGDGQILLNGLPFDQASDAEQLRASVAIAMASSPTLRVIRVRDGSLLDADGMRLLGEMADKHDCQVWVECVSSDGNVGFVIEDGHVASTPAARRKQGSLLEAAE